MVLANIQSWKFVTALAAVLVTAPSAAVALEWQPLDLYVQGVDVPRGGQLQVFVFLKDGFPIKHEKAIKSYVQPARERDVQIKIEVPTNTAFALKVHHDEDGSGQLTKNWTGIFPTEGLGFSAGAKINFGPPSFAEAQMNRPKDGAISILMRYP